MASDYNNISRMHGIQLFYVNFSILELKDGPKAREGVIEIKKNVLLEGLFTVLMLGVSQSLLYLLL